MKLKQIQLLETDNNKKGDLFGRLMSDFFHSIGYGEPKLNIHKPGREIDINCLHRIEKRIAIAECKAHTEKIGGADINKFVGAFDAEKRKIANDLLYKGYDSTGYFISLSGFKDSAIEQENEIGNDRIILIKPEKIVEELIRGRVLVSMEKGLMSLSELSPNYTLIEEIDLLAYEKGWIWVYYFSDTEGQKITHFGLVHAEGKMLIKELAEDIVEKDRVLNNLFKGLHLLNDQESESKIQEKLLDVENKYFTYLENELGEIQFEGLPTDKEAGSVKVKLENIFVPLHLTKSQSLKTDTQELDMLIREGIGAILENTNRLAILAKPGGGKSTLIKRIAIAYAFPERRLEINDNLPEKKWFPIFLRCRELGDKITLSITDIINTIPNRAEINYHLSEFSKIVSNTLQSGNALLLIDGLDEIAEERNRVAFVNQLRTFIATYPKIGIIVTSREAGFRVVAGSLATYCENYIVSNLIETEIEELSIKWHKAIIDDSNNTINEAKKVSEIIIKDTRIKALAENPLLLTTLLFVKRWAGYLPTKRNVLYQEMIKLLLVTWNVEGHEQLDIEEAEPQLAFVAYWMTKNGHQTITEEELKACLIEARKQMPEILGYTKISPPDFIKRVESRSSLLIMAGHKRLDTVGIVQVYEFLHLSFQEYLTAKALVKRYIPKNESEEKILDIIIPNIHNENWKEVIPLMAVLLERETKELIEFLINETKETAIEQEQNEERYSVDISAPSLLANCLANEIQIGPEILDKAFEWYAKCNLEPLDNSLNEIILRTKFGTLFRNKIKNLYCTETNDKFLIPIGSLMSEIFLHDLKNTNDYSVFVKYLKSSPKEEQCYLLFGLLGIGWEKSIGRNSHNEINKEKERIFTEVLLLLEKGDIHIDFAVSWCTCWCSEAKLLPESLKLNFINQFLLNWINYTEFNLRRVSSWALKNILYPALDKNLLFEIDNIELIVNQKFDNAENEFDQFTSIYLSFILNIPLDREKLINIFKLRTEGSEIKEEDNLMLFAKALGIDISITKKI
jgi:hypothetical protein